MQSCCSARVYVCVLEEPTGRTTKRADNPFTLYQILCTPFIKQFLTLRMSSSIGWECSILYEKKIFEEVKVFGESVMRLTRPCATFQNTSEQFQGSVRAFSCFLRSPWKGSTTHTNDPFAVYRFYFKHLFY